MAGTSAGAITAILVGLNHSLAEIEAIGTVMDCQDSIHLHSDDWQRTIYINSLGVKTTDFKLSDQTKQALVDSGVAGVEAYFKWYDDASSQPANRP